MKWCCGELEEADIPRFLFINKIDTGTRRVRETLELLQRSSRTPLLLRQIPIWKDGIAVGFIDLALERAFIYREHAPSEVVDMPEGELPREREARFAMLERLADYDDALMEELISEIEPPRDRVFDDLSRELKERHVVPVLIGSADRGNGVTRLLKALRHEAPTLADTRSRLGVPAEGPPLAHVVKTLHTGQGGKLSIARILRGGFRENETVTGSRGAETRIASLLTMVGPATTRVPEAKEGECARLLEARRDRDGRQLRGGQDAPGGDRFRRAAGTGLCILGQGEGPQGRRRLTSALAKIAEEDPAIVIDTKPEMGEMRLMGQGEMHLRVAIERLSSRFQVGVETGKAEGRLLRDDQAARIRAWSAQEADRRPWAVRRRDDRGAPARRAARASHSRTRSRAASCRASTSPRSRLACAMPSSAGRSAFPSSILL